MKITKEGYPFIAFFSSLTAIPFGLTLLMLIFFRDPEREIPEASGLVVSPADGKVLFVGDIEENRYFYEKRKKISIFMSPLDVHINRAPCEGKVVKVKHNPGGFMAAFRDEASLKNENTEMILQGSYGKILVRQVAGFLARRTVCNVNEGDKLERGQRYGMIKFSSRVDIYLPSQCQVSVKPGDKVKAGQSVIAKL
jgi:phosphatidylserine decarboxylase